MNVLFAFVVLLRPFGWPYCTGYFDDNIFVFVNTSQCGYARYPMGSDRSVASLLKSGFLFGRPSITVDGTYRFSPQPQK